MAKKITSIAPHTNQTEKTISLKTPNYASDFKLKKEVPGELILVNTKSPAGTENTIRIAQQEIRNIYASTDIARPYQLQSTAGLSVVVQNREIVAVSDPNDPTYEGYAPLSAHIVLTVPKYIDITDTVVLTLLQKTFGMLFNANDDTPARVLTLLRGALRP